MFVAIGLVEFNSVAKGIEAADSMIKSALVDLIKAQPVCPGKYIVLVSGEVGAVQTSVRVGKEIGDRFVVDDLIIPNVHPQVFPALAACTEIKEIKALGILETLSCASAIICADLAVKAAVVDLIEIRLAYGLGGKSFITLTGDVAAVNAAVETGAEFAEKEGFLLEKIVIPSPHQSLKEALL